MIVKGVLRDDCAHAALDQQVDSRRGFKCVVRNLIEAGKVIMEGGHARDDVLAEGRDKTVLGEIANQASGHAVGAVAFRARDAQRDGAEVKVRQLDKAGGDVELVARQNATGHVRISLDGHPVRGNVDGLRDIRGGSGLDGNDAPGSRTGHRHGKRIEMTGVGRLAERHDEHVRRRQPGFQSFQEQSRPEPIRLPVCV